MRKQILVLALVVLLVGVVSADYVGTIENIDGINISDFVAGSVATANFSFDYLDGYGNKQYPHILRMNITSENQIEYPVWKGDFELGGFVRKYTWFGLYHEDIVLECSEENPLTINHPLGLNVLEVPNGTFYCYNTTSEAIDNLNKHDEVYLTIRSHPALWPGQYNLVANVYYLNDTRVPFVNITNKGLFEKYYRENDNVLIRATINDASGIAQKWSVVTINGEEVFDLTYDRFNNGEYYFSKNTPVDINESDYELFVFAEDEFGNVGNDSVALRVDRTGPVIELVSLIGGAYDEILPIKFNVTDNKSGVDNGSVVCRLREIKEGFGICPETGGVVNGESCVTTPWISLSLNSMNGLFELDLNTTYYGITNISDGRYWLDAKASDVLNNEVSWIA